MQGLEGGGARTSSSGLKRVKDRAGTPSGGVQGVSGLGRSSCRARVGFGVRGR